MCRARMLHLGKRIGKAHQLLGSRAAVVLRARGEEEDLRAHT